MGSRPFTHYLDNAATSFPKPRTVHEAVELALATPGSPGRGSGDAAARASGVLEAARAEVAGFLGVSSASRLAFALNATDALNMSLDALVRPGSRIVTSTLEHSSVLRPLEARARARGAHVTSVAPDDTGRLDPRTVAAAARDADLVVLTAASNVTGLAQPVTDIAARLPPSCVLVVDAAQAVGALPLDVASLGPRAVTCFAGHKALLGPMGCGGIVLGDDIELPAWRLGGTGDGGFDQPAGMPQRLESGTPALPAIAGLAAGVRWLLAEGIERVRRREAGLLAQILEALRAVGAELPAQPATRSDAACAPLVVFRLPGWSPDEVAIVLESEHGVVLRPGLHCAPATHRSLGTWPEGLVRASIGPTTSPEDVAALCEGLRDLNTPR